MNHPLRRRSAVTDAIAAWAPVKPPEDRYRISPDLQQ
jgi:hypothetical protein